MPVYSWEGTDQAGKKVRGEMEAVTAQQVFNSALERLSYSYEHQAALMSPVLESSHYQAAIVL